MSGAILNRSDKTKLMGLGRWRDRKEWPLERIDVKKCLKIFGITFFPDYDDTLEHNWLQVFEEVRSCILSWSTRILNSVYQRVHVLNTFVLPKLWYKAEALPLPEKWAKEFDKLVYGPKQDTMSAL